jgi:hypothetical protein
MPTTGTDIIVLRAPGDKQGGQVIDPLLTQLEAALERGRNELDEHATLQQQVQLKVVFRPGLRLGQLCEVIDSLQGATWYGKIIGISHQISPAPARVETVLDILRPVLS